MLLLFKELGYIYVKKIANILSIIKKVIFAHGCSYHVNKHTLLFYFVGFRGCTVRCKAKYTNNNKYYGVKHCVGYNMSFHINGNLTSKFKDFPCDITNCILELIEFECTFTEENSELENLDRTEANKAPGNKTENINPKNTTAANGKCIGNFQLIIDKQFCNLY